MSEIEPSAHELQVGELHSVIEKVSDQLEQTTLLLAHEMVDANEGAIALNMVSEMLVERGARISHEVLDAFRRLAEAMGLEEDTVDRLRPLTGP